MQLGIGLIYNRIRYDTGDIILNDLKAVVLHWLLSTVEESVSSAALPHAGGKITSKSRDERLARRRGTP